MQDIVRALLQVVHRVGQVGALRVVEGDLVLDGIGFHLKRYGLRCRVDLVVAGDVDGALGHLGAERLVVDGLGIMQDLVRALLQVVHRVGQVGALHIDDIENIALHLNDEVLRSDDARLVSSRTLRVNSALVQAHRISEGLAIDHHSFVDPIFFRDGVPVVIDNVGEISSLLPLSHQGHIFTRHSEGFSRCDVVTISRELPTLELVAVLLWLSVSDSHGIAGCVEHLGVRVPGTAVQIVSHAVVGHILRVEVHVLSDGVGELDVGSR